MRSYVRFVLRFRWPVLILFLLVTVFFSSQLFKITISSSPGELFFGDSPEYLHYLDRTAEFSSDVAAIIAFEGDDLLSKASLERLEQVISTIEEGEGVQRVESLISTQHIQSRDDVLYIDHYVDLFKEQPERTEELLSTLATDELTRDLVITPDGRRSLVFVEFEPGDKSLEGAPADMKHILDAFEDYGFSAEHLYVGGLVAVLAEVLNESFFSLYYILPVTALVLLSMVYIMFRRLWPVFLTAFITGMAIVWTLGLAVIMYGHVNIFTTMIPALILITCFADVVHMVSSYLLELARGRAKRDAILDMGAEVGTACGYTSVTTFFGFVAMGLVPSPIFKQLGFLMGFGVAAALFMAMTLVPIFLVFLPQPEPLEVGGTGRLHGWLDRYLESVASVTSRRPHLIVAIFGIFFLTCLYGFSQVHFETQFSKRFIEENRIRQGVNYLTEHFHGAYPLEVYIDTPGEQGLLDPELFAKIADFEKWIDRLPRVNQVVSVVDLVRKMYREINPEMAAKQPLPDSRQALAQLLLLFEMSGGEDLNSLIDPDYQSLHLTVRIEETGVIETAEMGRAIRDKAREMFGDSVKVEALSLELLMGDWVDDIIRGQQKGLALALATIAAMMVIGLRSLRNGVLSMFPNVLPLLAVLGYVGIFWDVVDTDTMVVLMVAIGIGVDDTIHFLMRLRIEWEKAGTRAEAIEKALHYSGRAIIITSVVLVAGFAPFAWSDYFSVRILGTLLPFCLVVALAADLYLVPAFVSLGWIGFKSRRLD